MQRDVTDKMSRHDWIRLAWGELCHSALRHAKTNQGNDGPRSVVAVKLQYLEEVSIRDRGMNNDSMKLERKLWGEVGCIRSLREAFHRSSDERFLS